MAIRKKRKAPDKAQADLIMAVLRAHYADPYWALFEELRLRSDRRLDAWAMGMTDNTSHERIAFEVKVSRGDFLRELADPIKRRDALLCSNRFYFVAPEGLIAREELPMEAGLIEVDVTSRHLTTAVDAPFRECEPPTTRFLASVCRRVSRVEEGERKERLSPFVDHLNAELSESSRALMLDRISKNLTGCYLKDRIHWPIWQTDEERRVVEHCIRTALLGLRVSYVDLGINGRQWLSLYVPNDPTLASDQAS